MPIGDFEKQGWVLGEPVKAATCSGEIQGGPECYTGCNMGGVYACVGVSGEKIDSISYFLPVSCKAKDLTKFIAPHKLVGNTGILLNRPDGKFISSYIQCEEESEGTDDSAKSIVHVSYPDGYKRALDFTGDPIEQPRFKLKAQAWFRGLLEEKAELSGGPNFCAKNYDGAHATAIIKKTKTLGQFQVSLIHGKGSQTLAEEFFCTLPNKIEFPNGKFSAASYKEIEENGQLPPSKQRPASAITKKYEKLLLEAARQKLRCPEGMSMSTPWTNLSEDTVGVECKSQKKSLAQLCPANTRAKSGGSGSTRVTPSGVSTEEVSVADGCIAEDCYPNTSTWKGGCLACPKGTKFDLSETEKAYKKGAIDRSDVLCSGPAALANTLKKPEDEPDSREPASTQQQEGDGGGQKPNEE